MSLLPFVTPSAVVPVLESESSPEEPEEFVSGDDVFVLPPVFAFVSSELLLEEDEFFETSISDEAFSVDQPKADSFFVDSESFLEETQEEDFFTDEVTSQQNALAIDEQSPHENEDDSFFSQEDGFIQFAFAPSVDLDSSEEDLFEFFAEESSHLQSPSWVPIDENSFEDQSDDISEDSSVSTIITIPLSAFAPEDQFEILHDEEDEIEIDPSSPTPEPSPEPPPPPTPVPEPVLPIQHGINPSTGGQSGAIVSGGKRFCNPYKGRKAERDYSFEQKVHEPIRRREICIPTKSPKKSATYETPQFMKPITDLVSGKKPWYESARKIFGGKKDKRRK